MEEADEDGRGGESSSTNFSASACISAIVIVDMKLGITGRFVTIVDVEGKALLDRFLLFLVTTASFSFSDAEAAAAVVVVFGSVGECSWWHDEGDFIVLL